MGEFALESTVLREAKPHPNACCLVCRSTGTIQLGASGYGWVLKWQEEGNNYQTKFQIYEVVRDVLEKERSEAPTLFLWRLEQLPWGQQVHAVAHGRPLEHVWDRMGIAWHSLDQD